MIEVLRLRQLFYNPLQNCIFWVIFLFFVLLSWMLTTVMIMLQCSYGHQKNVLELIGRFRQFLRRHKYLHTLRHTFEKFLEKISEICRNLLLQNTFSRNFSNVCLGVCKYLWRLRNYINLPLRSKTFFWWQYEHCNLIITVVNIHESRTKNQKITQKIQFWSVTFF